MPATVGVFKHAALDFDGEYISSTDMAEGGWSGYHGKIFDSFQSLFTNSRPWLDMNGDNTVNGTDANLAINYVMNKVKADFAPFMLSVFQMDQDSSQLLLKDSIVGDVSVIITGSDSTALNPGSNLWGFSPGTDVGNTHDEIVFVFAGGSVDSSTFSNRFEWLNQVAQTVSHEMGHAFGLHHEVSDHGTQSDALSHSIMGTTNRDFHRDFVFEDMSFKDDTGVLQNSYYKLLDPNVLGRSFSTDIGVFKPGVLTVLGNYADNRIFFRDYSTANWEVTIDGKTTYVGLNSYDVNSVNPFDQKISSVEIYGEGGNDFIAADNNHSAPVVADGGAGNDTIFGGSLNDRLYGGDGNDDIYGSGGNDFIHGGNGDDYLYGEAGNDTIYGGNGNDYLSGGDNDDMLYGQGGYDVVYGGNGNDYLDGGADGIADYLYGGPGADKFKTEMYRIYGYFWFKNRDNPADFNSAEGDQLV